MKNRVIAVALAISFPVIPATSQNTKNVELFLKSHPKETQNGGSCADKDKQKCLEVAFLRDAETQVLEAKDGILVAGEISKFSSGQLAVLLLIANFRHDPVEAAPEKVFLIDDLGQQHLPIPDYVAKANVAQEHHLAPFNPPPPRTYYSVKEVPTSSQAVGPMYVYAIQDIGTGYLLYGTQPRVTNYERAVTERTDYSNVLGYEIGYLIASLIKKHDAKSKIDWIDRNWFHPATLGFKGFDLGYLTFLSTQDMLTNRGLSRPVKLVVVVEYQQFVFEYGPDLIEKPFK
jgi:hypothetical protein